MTEWKEYKLGEIATFSQGVQVDVNLQSYVKEDEYIRFVRIVDYTKMGEELPRYIKNPGDKYLVSEFDLVMIRYGSQTAGKVVKGICGAIANNMFKIDLNSSIADNVYVYYWLSQNSVQDYFMQSQASSTMPAITFDMIGKLEISLPPLPEQIRIASILSSLDDKIDLLHRENKTLEAMAETLFRQWFIEEAKEDWEEGKLGDFVSVIDNRGKTPPYTDNITEYPIIEVNALTGTERYVKYNLVKKYVEKDIYDSWFRGYFRKYDIFVSTVGSIGELAMCLEEKGVIAQNVIALHANNISPFYLYQYLNYNKDDLKGLDIGSVQPSIKVPHLLNMSIIIPPHDKLKEYDIIMLDIIEKEEKNIKQIQTLIQQRDSLLPKLMSGEVKI